MNRRPIHRWLAVALAAGAFPARGDASPPAPGPDLPAITVSCGEVTLLLRRQSQWTPGRIDFRGVPLTTERSAYGTVFSFPGVGFIGTAHLENEPEQLGAVAFHLDGAPVAEPGEILRGESFRFERESRVRSLRLSNVIEIKDNRLHETAAVSADEDTPLTLLYHFMHAWAPTVSAFLAGRDEREGEPACLQGGPLGNGEDEARQFHVRQDADWVAVFEPGAGMFAVSRLLEAPGGTAHESLIWNVPGAYRKYYLKCFANETVPAGFTGVWRMVTGFGESSASDWEAKARQLAADLRE